MNDKDKEQPKPAEKPKVSPEVLATKIAEKQALVDDKKTVNK
jgi:hypothetical protein